MIKNCKVLINNEAVTVINYDGVDIQIPAIKRDAEFVKVVKKNGNYIVVDDNYVEPAVKVAEKPKKKIYKKTTNETLKNEDAEISCI